MKKYALLLLTVISAQATAKPVYLDCLNAEKEKDGTAITFNITFDEDAGTLSMSNGKAALERPVTFTAKEVRSETGGLVNSVLRIDRATGAYSNTIIVGAGGEHPIVSRGACKVATTPKRQF